MRLFNIIVVLIVTCASYGSPMNLVNELHFPEGAEFGMSIPDLKVVRPKMVHGENPQKYGAFEIESEGNKLSSGFIYHFKDGRLGAVQYTWSSTNMLSDVETKRVYRELSECSTLPVNRKMARGGNVYTVKCWSLLEPEMEVCFEASNKGSAIMFYSTNYFSFRDFFPQESKASEQAYRKKKNSRTEYAEIKGIDRLSTNAPPHAVLKTE
jgi:hypothetical protein